MKIGTFWALGMAPPPSEVSWACSRPPLDLRCLLMMLVLKFGTIWALGVPPPSEVSWACSRSPSDFALCSDDARDENLYYLGSGCPLSEMSWACPWPPSDFALCSDDAHHENWCDLGSGCAPHQRCLGPAPGTTPNWHCVLLVLVMKIGTIWALGSVLACSRPPSGFALSSDDTLMMSLMKFTRLIPMLT